MKHLQLTQSTNPSNPLDGSPYVFYNPNINKVWIYLGLNWILEDGTWNMDYQWANNGRWNRYDTRFGIPVYSELGEIERYNIFRARMLVRCDKNNKLYLYDIMQIKKETSTPHE